MGFTVPVFLVIENANEVNVYTFSKLENTLMYHLKSTILTCVCFSCSLVSLAIGASTKIYFTDLGPDASGAADGKIMRANLDGTGLEELIAGLDNPGDIVIDESAGKMYWPDYFDANSNQKAEPNESRIQRANLDGSGIEDVVTGLRNVLFITLDSAANKIYWSERGEVFRSPGAFDGKIQRANLDGSGMEDVLSGLDNPHGIELDSSAGKVYWTDNQQDTIHSANIDGTGQQTLLSFGLGSASPMDITLDPSAGKMYWSDVATQRIRQANLDGTTVTDIVTGLGIPRDNVLDLPNGKIYWTDRATKKIQRANIDGTNVEDLITAGLPNPSGIALGPVSALDPPGPPFGPPFDPPGPPFDHPGPPFDLPGPPFDLPGPPFDPLGASTEISTFEGPSGLPIAAVAAIPEPSTFAIAALGFIGLLARRRRYDQSCRVIR